MAGWWGEWNSCSQVDFPAGDMQVDKIRFQKALLLGSSYSKQGSERLIQAAIDYALAKGLK